MVDIIHSHLWSLQQPCEVAQAEREQLAKVSQEASWLCTDLNLDLPGPLHKHNPFWD